MPPVVEKKKKRVAIVGAGSAGMSAAYALSLSPELFDVTLCERSTHTGGMATSTEINAEKYGAAYINDGVQGTFQLLCSWRRSSRSPWPGLTSGAGASPVFYNVFKLFELLGFESTEVGMQCSFGKGEDEFWSNVFPSEVIDQCVVSFLLPKTC